jgi:iron complex transport system substrate-binding protein
LETTSAIALCGQAVQLFHAKAQSKRRGRFVTDRVERVASVVIDVALKLHIDVGPGLLESVYEAVLEKRLRDCGLKVDRQQPIKVEIDNLVFPDAFRADLLVEDCLIVEVKSVEALLPVHGKQLLTYLRLMNLPLGLLINFGGETLKQGLRRIVNNHIANRP